MRIIFIFLLIQTFIFSQEKDTDAVEQLIKIDKGKKSKSTKIKNKDADERKSNKKNKTAKTDKNVTDKDKSEKKIKNIKLVLSFGNSRQVREAIKKVRRLTEVEQDALVSSIGSQFKRDDILINITIVSYLSYRKNSSFNSQITKCLNSKNGELVLTSIGAVEKLSIKKALPTIREVIKKSKYDKAIRNLSEFIRLAGFFKDIKIKDFLFEKLNDDETLVNYKTSILLYFARAEIKDKIIQEYIVNLAKDEEADLKLRPYAVNVIGKLELNSANSVLKEILKKIDAKTDIDEKRKYAKLRLQTISAMVRLKNPGVKEILYSMSKDDDESVRIGAIRQIGRLKDSSAIEMLEFKSKFDPSLKVQKAAKKALENIKGG